MVLNQHDIDRVACDNDDTNSQAPTNYFVPYPLE